MLFVSPIYNEDNSVHMSELFWTLNKMKNVYKPPGTVKKKPGNLFIHLKNIYCVPTTMCQLTFS